jgi:hypothetical protein
VKQLGVSPLWKGQPLQSVLDKPLSLADAHRSVARERGFDNSAVLKRHIETADRVARFKPHLGFDDAVAALDAGDLELLRSLVDGTALGPNGGTTMRLLVTSKHASDADVSGPLLDLLCERGATLDLKKPGALDASLAITTLTSTGTPTPGRCAPFPRIHPLHFCGSV